MLEIQLDNILDREHIEGSTVVISCAWFTWY